MDDLKRSHRGFTGFPLRVRFTPVPNPLLGQLLEDIDDLAEFKCTLRLVWMLHNKTGPDRYVPLDEVLTDRVLRRGLDTSEVDAGTEVRRGLRLALRRGTVMVRSLKRDGVTTQVVALNSGAVTKAFDALLCDGNALETATVEVADIERPNIYGLYEDNIGLLNPMIAEELKGAEKTYPMQWIEDAFKEAVTRNKRNWRYISVILGRWEREGRDDGRPVRSPEEVGYERYLGR